MVPHGGILLTIPQLNCGITWSGATRPAGILPKKILPRWGQRIPTRVCFTRREPADACATGTGWTGCDRQNAHRCWLSCFHTGTWCRNSRARHREASRLGEASLGIVWTEPLPTCRRKAGWRGARHLPGLGLQHRSSSGRVITRPGSALPPVFLHVPQPPLVARPRPLTAHQALAFLFCRFGRFRQMPMRISAMLSHACLSC